MISGLKNARAKGKIIGRVRKRNSDLIESLLEAGMSFRAVARIAACSHGSVSAQKKEWLAKKKLAAQKEEDQKILKQIIQDREEKAATQADLPPAENQELPTKNE